MISKPVIIKSNALYRDKDTYKIMLLWKNNLNIPNIEESYVEIHLILDNKEETRFDEYIIDTNTYNTRYNIWGGNGNPSLVTIRTFNEIGLYGEVTIPFSFPDKNIRPISTISLVNCYINYNEMKDGINGIGLGWDNYYNESIDNINNINLEKSLFCYSVLISGYTPEQRYKFYLSDVTNHIFVPYSSIPWVYQNVDNVDIVDTDKIKIVIVDAINYNEESGKGFIYRRD